MGIFTCKKCGEAVSKNVLEIEDLELLNHILPTYRLIDASDAQDSVPEAFYVYDEEKELYRLNIEDSESQLIDYEDLPVSCCGIPWSDENNLECKNGHKIGREVSDCSTKHSCYLDPEKVDKEPTEETNVENSDTEELLNILENADDQDRKRAAFILVVRDKRGLLTKDERDKALDVFGQLIKDNSTPDHTKAVLIKSLAELDGSRNKVLKQKLRESNSKEIRKVCALLFKNLTQQEVLHVLIPAIESEEDPAVRLALAKKISENSTGKIIDELVDLLSKDVNIENKISISDALRRIRHEDIEKLKKAVKELTKEKQKLEDAEKSQKIEYIIRDLKGEIESYHNSRLYLIDYLRLAGWLILYSPWILYNAIRIKLETFREKV